MKAERLPGGNLGGAVRIGDTVRRRVGPWTPSVAALLDHLEEKGFTRAPRFLGIDDEHREMLTFVDGETVGDQQPWPSWVYADETLDQVAEWLRLFHEAVSDFEPAADAVWRSGRPWTKGLVIGHNDAAPYNAVWRDRTLAAFIDWEFAAPVTREWDLAYVAFSWVPLHARDVVEAEGFSDFEARPARLERLLDRYGWQDEPLGFIDIVRQRALSMADDLRALAANGDVDAARLVAEGRASACERAAKELSDFRP
jgi:aminoglycoside phosphotransferase (APT) family kinase protein